MPRFSGTPDLTELVRALDPYLTKKIKSSVREAANTVIAGSTTSALPSHSLASHTGQLLTSQALWVDSHISIAVANHAANPDAHHAKLHGMTSPDAHFYSGGNAMDVFGLTAPSSLGTHTPSSNPGTSTKILKTDTFGLLRLALLDTPMLFSTFGADLTIMSDGDLVLTGDLVDVLTDMNIANDLNVTGIITAGLKVITGEIESPIGFGLSIIADSDFVDFTALGLRMYPDTLIQSNNFSSQLAGWRMTYTGELDARYIYADQLKIKIFIADISMALAGSEIITKSVTSLADDFYVPLPGQSVYTYMDDLPSAEGMAAFESGDKIRYREFSRAGGGLSVTDCWGNVSAYADQADKKQRWTFTRDGTNGNYTIAETGTRRVANTTGTSSTVTKVTDTTHHDTMLTMIVLDRTATITAPSGWTLLASHDISGGRVALYKKIATASEPSNYTWNFSSSGVNMVVLVAYHFVAEISDWYTSFNHNPALAPTISFPDTWGASTQGDMMLTMVGIIGDQRVTPHASLTEVFDAGYSGTLSAFVAHRKLSARGASGDMSSAFVAGTNIPHVVFSIGLLPAYTLDATTGYAKPGTLMAKEQIVLDYGVSGNGYIELTTVDGLYGSNSPYMRVVTWTGHPATGSVVRTLNGNLNGIFGVANEFGYFAGTGVTDNDSYMRLSSNAYRLNNIPIKLYTSGTQKVNIDAGGVDIWIGSSSVDKRLTWNGTTLGVSGSISVTAASSIAGSGYIQIGTGVVNSTLDGWYMSPTNILGQTDGITQVELTAGGKIAAGGGLTYLDASGLSIIGQSTNDTASHTNPRSVTFYTTSFASMIGRLTGSYISGVYNILLYSRSPDTEESNLILKAQQAGIIYSGVNAGEPSIILKSDGFSTGAFISMYADTAIKAYVTASADPDLTIDNSGIMASRSVTIGASVPRPVADGCLSIGSTARSYTPLSSGDWTSESTILLTGLDYTTIGFHDSSARVDYIRVGAGVMTLGYDAGWGAARVIFGGVIGDNWTNFGNWGSGWTNLGGGYLPAQYKKVGDLVFLRGLVVRTTGSGTTIQTMPAGYRPPASYTALFGVDTQSGHGRVDIASSGVISLVSGGAGYVQLDGIVYGTT